TSSGNVPSPSCFTNSCSVKSVHSEPIAAFRSSKIDMCVLLEITVKEGGCSWHQKMPIQYQQPAGRNLPRYQRALGQRGPSRRVKRQCARGTRGNHAGESIPHKQNSPALLAERHLLLGWPSRGRATRQQAAP